MKTLKKFIAAVTSAGLMSLYSTPPAFAAINITIRDNGSETTNTATITTIQTNTVSQYNEADVENTVDVTANTGNNDANDNTGGDVDIDTGKVTATSTVTNLVNGNEVDLDCGCLDSATVNITGNGTGDDGIGGTNTVTIADTTNYDVEQSNYGTVTNTVTVDGDSGNNQADDNTNGNVGITTDDVLLTSSVINDINDNWAELGSSGLDGMITVNIIDNGSETTNIAGFTLLNTVDLDQWNEADVFNDVDVIGNSGNNDANDNTGGDVSIDTGKVTAGPVLDSTGSVVINAGSVVDNTVNFNEADLDCCTFDVNGTIAENGTESTSTIAYADTNTTDAEQSNYCGTGETLDGECDTTVLVDGDTGFNTTDDNTNGTVSVTTDDATTNSTVVNDINFNDLGTL